MDNQLITIVKQSGLQETKAETLMKSFAGYFGQAKEIVDQCKGIVVTREDQTELMQQARDNRLKLKNIRVECEKTRKELKEQSLMEGRAIDGIANVIKALIVPVEEQLEKQEKFAEIQEQLRVEKRFTDRTEKLSQYVPDISLYAIRDMDDEVFNNLLEGCKASWEKAKRQEEEAEAKRIADEKAEIERRKKIEAENKKLREEAEAKEKELAVERAKQADDLRKANEAREKVEAKLRAEKEAQAKKEAEEAARVEAEKRAKEEADKKALLAPDKEKLLSLADKLDMQNLPAVSSHEAQLILEKVETSLSNLSDMIREEAKKL